MQNISVAELKGAENEIYSQEKFQEVICYLYLNSLTPRYSKDRHFLDWFDLTRFM